MPTKLEALFEGLSRWCDCGHGSSAADPIHRPVYPFLGIDKVVRLGLFQSIRPTMKYQARKANIVADALSQSQRPIAEDVEEATNREEVLQLTSSSVEPQA